MDHDDPTAAAQPGGQADGMPRDRAGRNKDGARAPLGAATLEKLFDRVPPHSLEAEMSLLGSLLLDPTVIGDVISLVNKPEQFYSQSHATIFNAVQTLYDQTQTLDVVQLADMLRDEQMLDAAGGDQYLVELAACVPSATNAARYARIVANKARLRKLIDASGEILYEAYHAQSVTEDDVAGVIDAAEQRIFEIASEEETSGPEKLARLIADEFDRIEAFAEGKGHTGVDTGYIDFDEMTSGLQPGELLILAARPSMGKTALALNMAEQVAFGGRTPWSPRGEQKEPQPVGVFSLEMSREALAQRLLSARSGVDAHKMRTGQVGKADWEKLHEAAAELYEAPIYIDDTPGLTILQMRAKARRMMDRYGLKAIFIDYLQLLTAPHAARESRQVEVSTISRQTKALARELKVPIVCLAQLNRGAEQREQNRPRMSDLRESGSIEQDADVVMLLHREAYFHRGDPEWDQNSPEYNPEVEEKRNVAELILAKQRNGPTGTVKFTWDEATTRFKNWEAMPDGFSGGGAGGYGPSATASGFGSPASEAAPQRPTPSAQAEPKPDDGGYRGAFTPGTATGPAQDHRDGGGPDHDWDGMDESELPPF